MILRGFQSGNTFDRVAAAQQLVLIMALYRDDEQGIRALLGPNAQLVRVREYDAGSWPPSWVVITDGRDYWIVFEGTTNLRQLLGHVWGSWSLPINTLPGLPDVGPRTVYRNEAWQEAYRTVWAEIGPLLPADLAGRTVRFSGHSYGSAVAMIAAHELLKAQPGASVEVMTFGSPKVWTEGFQGPLPAVCWNIQSASDPVTAVPPKLIFMFVGQVGTDPTQMGSQSLLWEHFGDVYPLGYDGRRGRDRGIAYPLDELVGVGIFQEHQTTNYMGRVLAGLEDGA